MKDLARLYETALLIRLFEEKVDWLFARGRIGGTTHLCIGQEAVATGVVSRLRPEDYVVSTHRGHGHLIARGADPARIFAELFGKREGYCQGRGGTQHICVTDINFLGTNGITGGGIPIATGAGLSIKLSGEDRLSVCFFGDGASNQGCFYESLNMASIWKLPVVFVCENNMYGMSTRFTDVSPFEDVAKKAEAFGIKSWIADGMDIADVTEKTGEAIEHARGAKAPVLVEGKTYRYCGHSKSDARVYRTREEEAEWRERDPIANMEIKLSGLVGTDGVEKIRKRTTERIEAAYEWAMNGTDLTAIDAAEGVYAENEGFVPQGDIQRA